MTFQADIELKQRLRRMNSALRKKTYRELKERSDREKNRYEARKRLRAKQTDRFVQTTQTTFVNVEEEPRESKRIFIPFKEVFKEALHTGVKTMTSRTFRAGESGDTFDAYGATFKILNIEEMRLESVAHDHFIEEAFTSTDAFIKFWNQIHPIKEYDPDQLVYVHKFERV